MDEKVFSIKPSTKLIMFDIFKAFGTFIIFTIVLMIIKNLIESVIEIPFNIFGWITTIAFLITIYAGIKSYIVLSSTYYTLYPKNFVYQKGFFNIKRENLEVYRIVDISSSQTFVQRMLGIGNVMLHTIDRSDPILFIDGIDNYLEIEEQIKEYAGQKRPTVIESYGPGAKATMNPNVDMDNAPSISDQK